MSYEITLSIQEDSAAGRSIESLAEAEHVSREEAALRLLTAASNRRAASPAALRILGLFSAPEDAAIMNEAVEIAMADRQRRNAEPPPI